jgi:hypothetical protein
MYCHSLHLISHTIVVCLSALQLAPWSTPHLRARLKNSFGVDVDPELVDRTGIMQHLLEQYTARGPRMVGVITCKLPRIVRNSRLFSSVALQM